MKISQEDFLNKVEKIHGDKYLYNKTIYTNARDKITVECKIHGNFEIIAYNFVSGRGCQECGKINFSNNKSLSDYESSLGFLKPDLIEFTKDKSVLFNTYPYSRKKILCICPDCGNERLVVAQNLYSQGFSCDICSDGISIPEKFIKNLLLVLGIEFECQYSPLWANGKRYDFYLSEHKTIIEVHGKQHYIYTGFKRSINEEIENDIFKEKNAKSNFADLRNYIVVDCRSSELEWLVDNIKQSLSKIIDLSSVNWKSIYASSQKSILKQVCTEWSNEIDCTTSSISKKFHISEFTVRRYLKTGVKMGWCEYSPKEEMVLSAKRASLKRKRKVGQYSIEGKFIREYDSIADVGRVNNINTKQIYACCSNNQKTACGYIWKYLT